MRSFRGVETESATVVAFAMWEVVDRDGDDASRTGIVEFDRHSHRRNWGAKEVGG